MLLMSKSELIERIRSIRKRTGLTGEQFSKIYHIPFGTFRKREGGFRTPPLYVVELLEYRVKGERTSETNHH